MILAETNIFGLVVAAIIFFVMQYMDKKAKEALKQKQQGQKPSESPVIVRQPSKDPAPEPYQYEDVEDSVIFKDDTEESTSIPTENPSILVEDSSVIVNEAKDLPTDVETFYDETLDDTELNLPGEIVDEFRPSTIQRSTLNSQSKKRDVAELRNAIIWMEILQKPKCLRPRGLRHT